MGRWLTALCLAQCSILSTGWASDDALQKVPLIVHVAERGGEPVADDAFVRTQLAHADAIYRKLGIALVLVGRRRLPAAHAEIIERRDRDALAAHMAPRVVNWFVVAKLMDVDEPGRERRGVHWHVRGARARRFVIVSAISGPYVLAHELGHFFGNPAHSDVPGNLMSYQLTGTEPVLDAAQQENVRRAVQALRQRGLKAPRSRAR